MNLSNTIIFIVQIVLVDFQNGKIQPGEEKSLNSALFREKVANKKLIGVSNGDMIYSGLVTDDTDYNSFLIVQNDESKEVTE